MVYIIACVSFAVSAGPKLVLDETITIPKYYGICGTMLASIVGLYFLALEY